MTTVSAHPPLSRLRAVVRVAWFLLWTLVMLLPTFMCWALTLDRLRAACCRIYYKGVCRIISLYVEVRGALARERPLLLVSNHASYLDVFVIGGLGAIAFTPKREVRSWPIVGFLCVLADCVFVERRPSHMQEARSVMRKRLSHDKILCLFPEGTTSDNSALKPFKSGFFSLAEAEEGEAPLPVQPVTLAYTAIGGVPMQPQWRERVAWVGDDTFFDHFWRAMKLPSISAVVQFHPARLLTEGDSRKQLSQDCAVEIALGLKAIQAEVV